MWRERLPENIYTVLDDTPCVFRASNYEELTTGVRDLMESPKLKKDNVEKFYKEFISGGTTLNESIIDNYITAIQQVFSA